jgi:tRNA(Ile)-lysidine synthase
MDRLFPAWANVPGVVAVSGGADSVALLRAITEIGGNVTAAHLNHQLRGAESDEDESFVLRLADSLSIPVRTTRIDVAALGGNLESTARQVRYEWLVDVAQKSGAGWIATGHTANDQAETVLHRLIRGTGLRGLRGIAGERPGLPRPTCTTGVSPAARIVRPLLDIPRSDPLAYLQTLDQPYRTDSSNTDPRFTRNRIRSELLPLLRTFNPGIVDVLNRLSEQADEFFTDQQIDTARLLREIERPQVKDTLILEAMKLEAIGEVKVRVVLRLLWDREQWSTNGMTYEHWKRAAAIALGVHPAADFPDGVHVRRVGKVVQLERTLNSPLRAQEGTGEKRKF